MSPAWTSSPSPSLATSTSNSSDGSSLGNVISGSSPNSPLALKPTEPWASVSEPSSAPQPAKTRTMASAAGITLPRTKNSGSQWGKRHGCAVNTLKHPDSPRCRSPGSWFRLVRQAFAHPCQEGDEFAGFGFVQAHIAHHLVRDMAGSGVYTEAFVG